MNGWEHSQSTERTFLIKLNLNRSISVKNFTLKEIHKKNDLNKAIYFTKGDHDVKIHGVKHKHGQASPSTAKRYQGTVS